MQWVFDRTESSGLAARDGSAQYLAVSQSAAQDDIDRPVAELRERYLPELQRLLPAARRADVKDFFVTRERTATFAPAPGVGLLRPDAPHERARPLPGRCVDRHRLARDHGERGAERSERRRRGTLRARPTASGPPAGGGGMNQRAITRRVPSDRARTSTTTRGETVTSAIPTVDTAGVTALLERGRTLATPVLRAAVNRLAPPMDTVAAYHFGWIDAEG
ncbi:hypothetical protein GCM10020000_14410 [Streptomyces olivoverticillatus]